MVVLDHSNGQVLAMASYPTFDNRWFNAGISKEKFDQLFPQSDDPDQSILVNRAVQGRYNIGSTIKPFIAWSAMHSGAHQGRRHLSRPGHVQAHVDRQGDVRQRRALRVQERDRPVRQAQPVRPGRTSQDALAVSSDAFFYRLGEEFYTLPGRRDELKADLMEFGFGADTGIDLPYEWDGRIPDDAVKKDLVERGVLAKGEAPRLVVGDLVQVAIGQGLFAATPLQLANAYATIANGGFVMRPHIVKNIYAPLTPDKVNAPGFADLDDGTVVAVVREARDHATSSRCRPRSACRSSPASSASSAAQRRARGAVRRVLPRVAVPLDHRREPVPGLPARRRSRSPARPARRRAPASTRGTTRRCSVRSASTRPGAAVHGRRLPREERLRLEGRRAGREVHVHRAGRRGDRWLDPVLPSDPLDVNSPYAAPPKVLRDDTLPGRLRRHRSASSDRDRLTLTFLQRKPDSGLGNIKSSPSDPWRNVDWVLVLLQAALATIGCFVIYSASRTKQADPFLFVTRQVVFLIAAVIAMVVVMAIDYEALRERARFLYGVTIMMLVLVNIAGTVSGGARLSFDLGPLKLQPAEFAKVTVLLALAALPGRRTQRRGVVPAVPRRADHGGRAVGADHHPARPRLGVGAGRDGDGRAAGRRREAEVHRR